MTAFASYRQALDYLFNFTDYERMHRVKKATSVFGLSRMNKLLDYCGDPHLQLRTVHIAGTKGKGSTAAMLASVLRAAGHRVGLYTSPHIYDIRERIQVDGEWISEADVTRWLNRLYDYLEEARPGGETYAPTFFETFTVISFLHFLERGVDAAVVEVGLGGRLDATNVLRPLACAITPVSFDHTDKLGTELSKIAWEKAGIIKDGVPVVSGVQQPEALEVIRARCEELQAPLHVVGEDITVEGDTLSTWRRRLEAVSVPLLGEHQRRNAAAAVGLADLLCERGFDVSDQCVRDGLASVRWPGRIQIVSESPQTIIDGAHNPASVAVLCEVLDALPAKRTVFVVGVAADKDVPAMLRLLAPRADAFVFTTTNNPRAATPKALREMLAGIDPAKPAQTEPSPGAALELARGLVTPGDRICATGSMYLAGDLLTSLKKGRD